MKEKNQSINQGFGFYIRWDDEKELSNNKLVIEKINEIGYEIQSKDKLIRNFIVLTNLKKGVKCNSSIIIDYIGHCPMPGEENCDDKIWAELNFNFLSENEKYARNLINYLKGIVKNDIIKK
ncbi:MAG: hypothetical protein JSV92_05175 [archaeon]|nr:MAG: hypothetical protein JSV92_05175 [archaeon]